MDTPQERLVVVLEMMMVAVMGLLHFTHSICFNGSANDWDDTDETAVGLLLAMSGRTRVDLDEREAKGLTESVGDGNRFRSEGASALAVRTVLFLVTASVINLGDGCRQEAKVSDSSIVGIRSGSHTHVSHLCDYNTDWTGTGMLSY